jgi:hypothetical protein
MTHATTFSYGTNRTRPKLTRMILYYPIRNLEFFGFSVYCYGGLFARQAFFFSFLFCHICSANMCSGMKWSI